jgi:hypothetical protein
LSAAEIRDTSNFDLIRRTLGEAIAAASSAEP